AAKYGLRAEIDNPLTGKPTSVRAFLKWTLNELKPLAQALSMWDDLNPLIDMSEGGRNTSEKIRARLQLDLGTNDEVPTSVLKELFSEHEATVKADVERITTDYGSLGSDASKIAEYIQRTRDVVRQTPTAPIRFRPRTQIMTEKSYPDKTSEILDLAQQLIRIPSVTASPNERLDEVHRAGSLIDDYLRNAGLETRYFDGKYPAVYAQFPSPHGRGMSEAQGEGTILLTGHFDVVEPEPDDSQFTPRIEGDYLHGRGAADMKTVVATYLVWMKDMMKTGAPYPNIALLLVGNEENGESEAWGTPHVLNELGLTPALFIAGERTGEKGTELFGEICVENRGVMRFDVIARGAKGHSGVAGTGDLSEKLINARMALNEIFAKHLTLKSEDGWQSQAKFPFINVGTTGVYNVTAAEGILGVEIRPIPQDDIEGLKSQVESYCEENGLELRMNVMENGVACDANNPALKALIEAVKQASGGDEPKLGKKLPGTSARFAPGGQAVVWGQSGIGPHAKNEAHYIPSIEPYYKSLNELAKLWK
ncbi:MAG TPA: M20/M25/M40 family metallo-hydrolase, partial [Anaerolineales bacterium]|nr:M20/M25/M40 family metallo-hydrolase [Anaerolineales bacterium]